MSSWNRPPDPHASAFSSSVNSGGSSSLARSPWAEPEQVPSWLRPFALDANTRFTRTPEVFLRRKGEPESQPVAPAPAEHTGESVPEACPETASAAEPDDAWTIPEAPFFPAAALTAELDDDDVLIDWTGESWAARLAAERGLLPPAVPANVAGEPVAVAPDTASPSMVSAPNEPMVLRRRLAEALAAERARDEASVNVQPAEAAPVAEAVTVEPVGAEPVAAELAPAEAVAGAPLPTQPPTPEPIVEVAAVTEPATEAALEPSDTAIPVPAEAEAEAEAETVQTVVISEETLSIASPAPNRWTTCPPPCAPSPA